MAIWSTYWSGATARDAEGELVDHIASNQFETAGVSSGDTMYVLTYVAGRLYVVTSLVVDDLVPRQGAEELLKRKNLWDAAWHVVARPDSIRPATMSAPLSSTQTAELVFINRDGQAVPPARNRRGEIDPQTFRATRRIDRRTASMFEQVLASSR